MNLCTIRGFAKWFRKNGRQDLADQLQRNWGWPDVDKWAETADIPASLRETFAADLIATGNADWMHRYLWYFGHREDVLAALIATGDARCLYYHQQHCGIREDVTAALMATGDEFWISRLEHWKKIIAQRNSAIGVRPVSQGKIAT